LPIRLFKTLKLQSIADSEVVKFLTSSGTTSHLVSRIAVDKETSLLQTKALASIITSFIGPKRLPMILVDSRKTLQNGASLSARGAGLVGLSNFGHDHFYALDEDMILDVAGLKTFIEKHHRESILIFGFTYMVWQYFCTELWQRSEVPLLDNAILLHGGGWKKLHEHSISNELFKEVLSRQCGIRNVHNFYGMVEQTGSIYMECEHGHLHAPNFADIIIRDYHDWSVLPEGEVGLIQTLSVLPHSYPGHSILTEDLGIIYGTDDCLCGRKGTHFAVQGRVPRAQLRGCSDVYAYGIQQFSGDNTGITLFLPVYEKGVSINTLSTNDIFTQMPLKPFDEQIIDFLSDVSQSIFHLPDVKEYPELVALAHWLRKGNITSHVKEFLQTVGQYELVLPRGIVFHVAPANVDTIFLYSWALSLLAGNLNIVRISHTLTPQIDSLLAALRSVMIKPEWRKIAIRNLVISYPREEKFNLFFSQKADVRMLWGGDDTVLKFRTLTAKPTTQDIIFADKVSFTLMHAERYVIATEKETAETARLFYNDAYLFEQMACSSPRIVYFYGDPETCERACKLFWERLSIELQNRNHSDNISIALDKLAFGCEIAAGLGEAVLTSDLRASRPTVIRVSLKDVAACRNTCGGGFFFECFIENIEELAQVVQSNDQTLTYSGFTREEMKKNGMFLCIKGIRRIAPVGQALAFSPVWDGYVLFNELTQRVPIM
jgi:hypothetical protein